VHIVVTLCTRRRPVMLQHCLRSIVAQQPPRKTSISIVVVENNETDDCRSIVEQIAAQCDVPIVYEHEIGIGIPVARNRSLELALALNPDWIAFVDDDEVASPDWIAALLKGAGTYSADVVEGYVQWLHAETGIAVDNDRKRRPSGLRRKTAATSNTMMRASIASAAGLGLRFDESMRHSGGSDMEYFFRAADRGAVIVWVDEAVVFESVPAERLTLDWQLQRERRIGANAVTIALRRWGKARTLLRVGPKFVGRVGGAGLEFLASAIIYPFNRTKGSQLFAGARRKVWWAAGALGGTFHITPQPYRRVDGY